MLSRIVLFSGAAVFVAMAALAAGCGGTGSAAGKGDEIVAAFYPLAYGAVPVTHGNIVRVAVSPAAIAALGVETIGVNTSPTDVLLADVVVGEDGLARAVRFVRTPARYNAQEQRP